MAARLRTLFFVFVLVGVGATPVHADDGLVVAALARNYLGVPYRWGGAAPDGFDCSGLVHYVYRVMGREVPRTARLQYDAARPVDLSRLRQGDLVFFTRGEDRMHVGIYVGENRFVHAPSRGKDVRYSQLNNSYWRARLVGAGRLSGS